DATPRSLASLMVGRELAAERGDVPARSAGDVVLRLDDLWVDGDRGSAALRGAALEVRAGEILAIAGGPRNGQREAAEGLGGRRPRTQAGVPVGGRPVRGDPRRAMAAGVAYVPEDRLGTGVAPSLSIESNLVLRSYRRPPASYGPWLQLRGMRRRAVD